MNKAQIEQAIEAIMKRRNAGSGIAVFVDPIVLCTILESVQVEGKVGETLCAHGSNRPLECPKCRKDMR